MATNTRLSTIWGMFFWPILGSETEEENYQRVCLSDLRALKNVCLSFAWWEPVNNLFLKGIHAVKPSSDICSSHQHHPRSEESRLDWIHSDFIGDSRRALSLMRPDVGLCEKIGGLEGGFVLQDSVQSLILLTNTHNKKMSDWRTCVCITGRVPVLWLLFSFSQLQHHLWASAFVCAVLGPRTRCPILACVFVCSRTWKPSLPRTST